MPASKAQRALTAERRTKALQMRVSGITLAAIAEHLDYSGPAAVSKDITRALEVRLDEQDGSRRDLVALELERLDGMERAAWGVLHRKHPLVSQGRVITRPDGEPIPDAGPVLAAIDRLVKIQDRRAKYLGLNAPIRAEIHNVDAYDREIEQFLAHMATRGQSTLAEQTARERPETFNTG